MQLLECLDGIRPKARLCDTCQIEAAPQIEPLRVRSIKLGDFLESVWGPRSRENHGFLHAHCVHDLHHIVHFLLIGAVAMRVEDGVLRPLDLSLGYLVNRLGTIVLKQKFVRSVLLYITRCRRLPCLERPAACRHRRPRNHHPLPAVHGSSSFLAGQCSRRGCPIGCCEGPNIPLLSKWHGRSPNPSITSGESAQVGGRLLFLTYHSAHGSVPGGSAGWAIERPSRTESRARRSEHWAARNEARVAHQTLHWMSAPIGNLKHFYGQNHLHYLTAAAAGWRGSKVCDSRVPPRNRIASLCASLRSGVACHPPHPVRKHRTAFPSGTKTDSRRGRLAAQGFCCL